MAETRKIYFGHPISFYNTTKESFLIKRIKEAFPEFEIENPNSKIHRENYEKWKIEKGNGMRYFIEKVIPKMDAGVFLAFEDKNFGAGVAKEAEELTKLGKPTYEINFNGEIFALNLDFGRFLTIEETRKRLRNFRKK